MTRTAYKAWHQEFYGGRDGQIARMLEDNNNKIVILGHPVGCVEAGYISGVVISTANPTFPLHYVSFGWGCESFSEMEKKK